jgi:hypothetical protein
MDKCFVSASVRFSILDVDFLMLSPMLIIPLFSVAVVPAGAVYSMPLPTVCTLEG